MNLIVYTISGPLRQPLLILEWIIVFLFAELVFILWIRLRTQRKTIKNLQDKAFIGIALGFSIMGIFFIISNYYVEIAWMRALFWYIGLFILLVGALYFIYIMEKHKKIFLKRYFLSVSFSLLTVVYFLTIIPAPQVAYYLLFLYWIFFSVFLVYFVNKLGAVYSRKKQLQTFKSQLIKFLAGIMLLAFGFVFAQMDTSMVVKYSLTLRLIADLSQIVSVIFLGSFLLAIPSFSEYDWTEKIDSLIIMHNSGLLLYYKNFRFPNDQKVDSSLISGTLMSVKMMLTKTTEREGISIIEKEGKNVIIQPSRFIMGVIICDEKLSSLQILLNTLIERIEAIYSGVLLRWEGDLSVFKPIEDIAEEIFF